MAIWDRLYRNFSSLFAAFQPIFVQDQLFKLESFSKFVSNHSGCFHDKNRAVGSDLVCDVQQKVIGLLLWRNLCLSSCINGYTFDNWDNNNDRNRDTIFPMNVN